MASLQIAFNAEQLAILADYYRGEEKKAARQLDNIRRILAKIEARVPHQKRRRGRPSKTETLAATFSAATSGKKRGRKPGRPKNSGGTANAK